MKNKVCFIIPHFGRLQSYFQLFLKTCSYNKNFDWLLITDERTKYAFPQNVRVVHMSYQDNASLIQSKFDFPIALHKAYKLCDFRPAYGYIYSDFLKGYSHWGHCDTDVLMGCLDNFITDRLLDKSDKMFCLGHMTIYKNTEENNRIFMNSLHGVPVFKDVLSSDVSCCFDEDWKDDHNIYTLYRKAGKSVFTKDCSLNIDFGSTRFVRVIYVGKEIPNNGHGFVYEKYKPAVYLWDNGHIYRYFKENNELKKEEFMYIHLQRRKMKNKVDNQANIIKIVPNSFLPLEVDKVTLETFDRIKKTDRNNHFWLIKVLPRLKNLRKKLGL